MRAALFPAPNADFQHVPADGAALLEAEQGVPYGGGFDGEPPVDPVVDLEVGSEAGGSGGPLGRGSEPGHGWDRSFG